MITTTRFRFNLSPQEALDMLAAAYRLQVENRQGTCEFDQYTVQNLTDFALYITDPRPKFGVYLCGTCGNGKTTLMRAFQQVLNRLDRMGHFDFLNEYFRVGMRIITASDIVQISRNDKDFNDLKLRSMLGIDDLGTEPAEVMDYGNVLCPVVRLIEERYNNQAFTFITTNLTPAEIRKKYGDRIADRFNEMLHRIVFTAPSYRGE